MLPVSEPRRSWCVFSSQKSAQLTPLSQDFRSASTGVAAKQMRNEINKLIESVQDPEEKRAFANEMQNFFMLFNRFLQEKARGEKL
jgi:UTP--glucose-1-phosphate uridylyltransferase